MPINPDNTKLVKHWNFEEHNKGFIIPMLCLKDPGLEHEGESFEVQRTYPAQPYTGGDMPQNCFFITFNKRVNAVDATGLVIPIEDMEGYFTPTL